MTTEVRPFGRCRPRQVCLHILKNLQQDAPHLGAERPWVCRGAIACDGVLPFSPHLERVALCVCLPFAQALEDFKPEIWLTGIRREETEHRKSLDIVSMDNRGIIKVAPMFYWSEEDVEDYMEKFELPSCRHYFDPTKVHDGRECGLHTAA